MRRTLQVVGVSAMAFWQAASDPRCNVKGYFQSTPFIFSCDGSGGDRDSNTAEVYMESRSSKEIVRIPEGTLDFVVSLDGDAEADLVVLDGSDNVVPHKMHSVGNNQSNQWLGHYKGMDLSYSANTGIPTKGKLSFSGSATPELSLRLVSHSKTPSSFRIGYYYFPYADAHGPQCRQGGAPVGCKKYHEVSVRKAVVDWAKWLLTRYAHADTAWAKLMIPLAAGPVVPYHHWCSAWNAWPAASSSPAECMAAYKFVTNGGLEAHATKISEEQFLWAFSLPAIASFDSQCCGKLRASFKHGNIAWDHIKKVQGKYSLTSPLQGLMKVCESVRSPPKSQDYALFLDADGDRPVGDILAEDIGHCWNEDATPSPTPVPMPSPTPTRAASPTSISQVPHSPTPSPTPRTAATPTPTPTSSPTPSPTPRTAATPTPTPTPMVQQQGDQTPTPTPAPLPSDLTQYLLPTTRTTPSPYTLSTSTSSYHHHHHLVSTTLSASVHKGAMHLLVGSDAGFQIGQRIDIDPGKPNHEVAMIQALRPPDLGRHLAAGLYYLGLHSGLHRQHEAGATVIGQPGLAQPTSTPVSYSTTKPRAPTPQPIWRVPTVFHYEHYHEKTCSGHSFTNGPDPSCIGWPQTTPQFCQEKCANSQTSPGCPRRPCMAAVFFADGGWCHLFTADQCVHLKSAGATTYKKASGGGHFHDAGQGTAIVSDATTSVTTITGSLGMNVPDADAFLTDTVAQEGVKNGIAETAGVLADYVSLTITKNRRLNDAHKRRLAGTAVTVAHTITIPQSVPKATADAASAKMAAVTPAQLSSTVASKVAAVKGAGFIVSVTSSSTPTVKTIGPGAHGLKKKHVPFLVAGIAGGAAAGAVIMAGAGMVISSVTAAHKGQPQAPQGLSMAKPITPPPVMARAAATATTTMQAEAKAGSNALPVTTQNGFSIGQQIIIDQGTALEETNEIAGFGSIILKHPLKFTHSTGTKIMTTVTTTPIAVVTTVAPTVAPTVPPTTSMPLSIWAKARGVSSGSLPADFSAGPMLPLVCLGAVCLCGLLALIVAAILDPCQRGGRKRVHSGGDPGGSVASLGDSVASMDSMDSEQAAYYDGYTDQQYGNSVASVGSYEGGSVYSQYGNSVGTYDGGSVGEPSGQYEYDHLSQNGSFPQQQDFNQPSYNQYGYPSSAPSYGDPRVAYTS